MKEPIERRAQPGYYPGFSTLAQAGAWDASTRKVVLARLEDVPPIRFFTAEQAELMGAILARILPQEDRDDAHQIPILNFVDERLFLGKGTGYRHEDMPAEREAYRLGLEGIEALARGLHGQSFLKLQKAEQDDVLGALQEGEPGFGREIWSRLPPARYFHMLIDDAVAAYYSHPWAWDEIGFGGPAYPRGYMRLEKGEPEPWEVEERRYEWELPAAGSGSGAHR